MVDQPCWEKDNISFKLINMKQVFFRDQPCSRIFGEISVHLCFNYFIFFDIYVYIFRKITVGQYLEKPVLDSIVFTISLKEVKV